MNNLITGNLFDLMLLTKNHEKEWTILEGEHRGEVFKLDKFDSTTLLMVNIKTRELTAFYHSVKVQEHKILSPYEGVEPKTNFKNRILVIYELEVPEDYNNDKMIKVIKDNGLNFNQCLAIGKMNDNSLFKAQDLLRDREERLEAIDNVLHGIHRGDTWEIEEPIIVDNYINDSLHVKIYNIGFKDDEYSGSSILVYALNEEDALNYFMEYSNYMWNKEELIVNWLGGRTKKDDIKIGVIEDTVPHIIKHNLKKGL